MRFKCMIKRSAFNQLEPKELAKLLLQKQVIRLLRGLA